MTTSEHRKIDLQSPSDLTHITTHIRHAATTKLNLHLPPVPNATHPDDLRTAVEKRVDDFINEVIRGVRANVAVNGLDVEEREDIIIGEEEHEEEEYEPFSEALRTKLASLHARRDKLISQISKHRRETPSLASQAYQAHFLAEEGRFSSALKGVEEGATKEAEVEGSKSLESVRIQRGEEVREAWEGVVRGLVGLKGGLGESGARGERAVGVLGFVKGKEGEGKGEGKV